MNTLREAAQQALEALIESARLLGATQAKKGFGCYLQEDAMLERTGKTIYVPSGTYYMKGAA
jgi:hypothetical protein